MITLSVLVHAVPVTSTAGEQVSLGAREPVPTKMLTRKALQDLEQVKVSEMPSAFVETPTGSGVTKLYEGEFLPPGTYTHVAIGSDYYPIECRYRIDGSGMITWSVGRFKVEEETAWIKLVKPHMVQYTSVGNTYAHEKTTKMPLTFLGYDPSDLFAKGLLDVIPKTTTPFNPNAMYPRWGSEKAKRDLSRQKFSSATGQTSAASPWDAVYDYLNSKGVAVKYMVIHTELALRHTKEYFYDYSQCEFVPVTTKFNHLGSGIQGTDVDFKSLFEGVMCSTLSGSDLIQRLLMIIDRAVLAHCHVSRDMEGFILLLFAGYLTSTGDLHWSMIAAVHTFTDLYPAGVDVINWFCDSVGKAGQASARESVRTMTGSKKNWSEHASKVQQGLGKSAFRFF